MDESKVEIQSLNSDWYDKRVEAIDMLRLDLLDPVISGNKWYKLKYNLKYAKEKGYSTMLTFGGAYSNHLIASAAAAKLYGIKAIGIVRGNDGGELTGTLKACEEYGMELLYVSRKEYAKKEEPGWLQQLAEQFDQPFIIPEGGANEQGREGAKDIATMIPGTYSHIAVSVGTGTTFTGLRNALPVKQMLLGFAPMKGGIYLQDEIDAHVFPLKNSNRQLFDRWHFGGFGKWNDALISFMNNFHSINHIPLDMVYTAKMMYGTNELLKENFFPANAKILCIHTGGLQGNASVSEKLEYNSRI